MQKTGNMFEPARREFLKKAGLFGAVGGTVLTGQAMGIQAAQAGTEVAAAARSTAAPAADIANLPRVKQTLVKPPFLPEHEQVATTGPKIVEVTLTIEEKKVEIDDNGTKLWAFTYNGTVPGPMIVCHEGDYVEVTLRNLPTNVLEHNVDFHSATGALGGGALTLVKPGEEVVLRWKATKAGVFVYHCAPEGIMIPYHVVQGMNGAVMVLPRDGLKDADGNPYRYDRAYFIGEQDYYVPRDEDGEFKEYAGAADNMAETLEVMRKLTPTHVVFNGAQGALTGDNAMKAKVGEKVLFIHAQANRDSRPHLIGGHGDLVWEAGSFRDRPAIGLETWFIRGGSAGVAAYEFLQPGVYAYVSHNLIEAVMLGAAAHIVVDGEWNDDLMMQVEKPTPLAS